LQSSHRFCEEKEGREKKIVPLFILLFLSFSSSFSFSFVSPLLLHRSDSELVRLGQAQKQQLHQQTRLFRSTAKNHRSGRPVLVDLGQFDTNECWLTVADLGF